MAAAWPGSPWSSRCVEPSTAGRWVCRFVGSEVEAASACTDKTKIPQKRQSGAGQTMLIPSENTAKCGLLVAVSTLSWGPSAVQGHDTLVFDQQTRRSGLPVKKKDRSLMRRCRHTGQVGNGAACPGEVEKAEGGFGWGLGNPEGGG